MKKIKVKAILTALFIGTALFANAQKATGNQKKGWNGVAQGTKMTKADSGKKVAEESTGKDLNGAVKGFIKPPYSPTDPNGDKTKELTASTTNTTSSSQQNIMPDHRIRDKASEISVILKSTPLQLIGTDETGYTHFLRTNENRIIALNINTGQVRSGDKIEKEKIIYNSPDETKYKIIGITDTGAWVYQGENITKYIIEPSSKQTQKVKSPSSESGKAGFHYVLLPLDRIKLNVSDDDSELVLKYKPR